MDGWMDVHEPGKTTEDNSKKETTLFSLIPTDTERSEVKKTRQKGGKWVHACGLVRYGARAREGEVETEKAKKMLTFFFFFIPQASLGHIDFERTSA